MRCVKLSESMEFLSGKLEAFSRRNFVVEDDVKVFTFSDIILPIQEKYAPNTTFQSEFSFAQAGRADGTVGNLVLEYKKYKYFTKDKGIKEALFGRNKSDSGLYQYIINRISGSKIDDSILDTFGIGFDGNQWIVARFAQSRENKSLDITRTRFNKIYGVDKLDCPYEFKYKVFNFTEGIEQIITLFSSTEKTKLSKDTLIEVFNPRNKIISNNIWTIYKIIENQCKIPIPQRTTTLYYEWDRTFGAMFGKENQETEFNQTSEAIRTMFNVDTDSIVDSKLFLFATQTYFNIVLKILIDSFIKKITNPSKILEFHLTWSELTALFEGRETENSSIISNFFEIHYYEWFTYLAEEQDKKEITKVISEVFDLVNQFDLATFRLRPETIQDILQEVYMSLIPDKMRHLLGEYFSPDWIVEHALNRIEYTGDINKKIIDPTCGSGAFLIQALKRVLNKKNNVITIDDAKKITNNIIGFDLNPISAVAAKANYILTLFSSAGISFMENQSPISIPIYISDSVLSPIVYAEESEETFIAKTSVGNFVIPKFETFTEANEFLDKLSESIDLSRPYNIFENLCVKNLNLSNKQKKAVKEMYELMVSLHRSARDSFWGRILKNSFAPVMLKQQFDFVVGNPPWIAWKSMSKVYREGTLDVWKSYGIFEKNAYDKKTTHDDFGMAVTYVALDQYLKNQGKLYFLLPWTFIKSTKGGEGFRKFLITRNNQQIPIKVELLDDFKDIKIFKPKHTVRTIGILLRKGKSTTYPMENWFEWNYKKKVGFSAHQTWEEVKEFLDYKLLSAKPIDSSDLQSAWLTLNSQELELTNKILLNGEESAYRGRKGIEPAGAKGVYILKEPKLVGDKLRIINDISRQRRMDIKEKGAHCGDVEDTFIYPMLGGRNIRRWKVISNEFMVVPHKPNTPYGLPEEDLSLEAPLTYKWLEYYKEGLLASRIQSGKFFNPDTQPWYRLDNVGEYTFSKYKVIWKEQSKDFAAVAIGDYNTLPNNNISIFRGKPVVVDSKVLMLATETMDEAYYVCGILNSKTIRDIIDAYAIGLNRGVDVLNNICIPKFNTRDAIHKRIVEISSKIHKLAFEDKPISRDEDILDDLINQLYK